MSFVEGNISVGIELAPGTLDRLKANLANLEKGINLRVNLDPGAAAGIAGIGKAADDVQNKMRQMSASGTTALNAIIDRAQQAGAVMGNLGIQIAKGAGVALAGLGIQAIHAGISFNTLQQKTTGALTSILGGVGQAKALLAQVNEFVNTSPFGRDTFLAATQTLVGFGVAATKVVPILGAVQNAVGGIGGSDQDISSIVQSLARVASAGHLTGDVLFSLQEKGIDAATIIAEQFGTTANAINDQVSAGTIDADRAFDALITGLNKKFPDAAANVKNTFTGVVQRMNAAIRDIGANLTAAFINPTGGGGAVEGVNNIATALRNIQKNVIPALLPITQALADGFKKASEAFAKFTAGIGLEKVKGFISSLAPLAPLLAGVGGIVSKIGSEIPVIGNLIPVLDPVVGIIAAILLKSQEFRDAISKLITTISPLVASILPPLVDIIDKLEQVFAKVVAALVQDMIPGIQLFLGVVKETVSIVKPFVDLLSGPIVSAVQFLGPAFKVLGDAVALAAVAFVAFNVQTKVLAAIEGVQTLIAGVGVAAGVLTGRLTALAVGETEAAAATGAMEGAVGGLGALLNPVTLAIVGLVGVYEILKPKALDAEVASKDLTQALEQQGKAADTATAALIAQKVSAKDFQGTLKDAGIDTADFAASMIRIAQAGTQQGGLDEMSQKLLHLSEGGGKAGKAADKLRTEIGNFQFDFIKSSDAAKAFNAALEAQKNSADSVSEALNGAKGSLGKVLEKLTTTADNLDKVRAASDSLRASQKALTELQKVTADELNDHVTVAERKLADVRRGATAVADAVTTAEHALNEVRRNSGAADDAVTRAEMGLDQARRAVTQSQEKLNILERDRSRLLADTGREAREVADAEATLARTGAELVDQDERKVELQKDLNDLARDTPDKLAAGDRSIERAKIALNNATREQLNLENELHKTQIANVDLTGLTPAQIQAKLAQVRAELESQKNAKGTLKTEQQIKDEVETASLNKADAEQGLKDSIQSRADLELSLNTQKREDEEALKALALDHEASLRRQFEQQQQLSILRSGDTQTARDLKSLNEEITSATDTLKGSVIGVRDAEREVETAKQKQADYAITIRDAEERVTTAKEAQSGYDITIRDAIRDVATNTAAIDTHAESIKNAQQKIKEDTQKMQEAIATAKTDSEGINAALVARIGLNATILAQNPELLKKDVEDILGTITQGTPGVETHIQKRDRLRSPLTDIMLNHPDQLLKFLRDNGFGFADGGIVNTETFARIGEAGREVVLPLTRPARMDDLLANSQVLHPVLAALGRIQLPSRTNVITSESSSIQMRSLGSGNGSNVFVSRADGPMTYGQAQSIIALLEANGTAQLTIEAPITVNSTIDEEMLQRKLIAQLERKVYEILGKRR